MVSVKAAGGESLGNAPRNEFPSVLFVNEVGPDDMAMCSVARQMLHGYPAERLSWWYCRASRFRGLKELTARSVYRFPLPSRLLPNRKLKELRGSLVERIWAPLAARHLG